jgi:3',5'-cyclic AMP phosphodiesterase CpdA
MGYMQKKLKIAQISDLHFSKISLHPKDLFSKSLIGNINLFFSRKKKYKQDHLSNLSHLFKKLDVDYVMIAGDISSTASDAEFKLAKHFFNSFKTKDLKLLFIPGNHDSYTKKAYKKKLFYKHFENHLKYDEPSYKDKPFSLKKNGIDIYQLTNKWWYIGLDTSVSTSLFSSRGLFSNELKTNLEKALSKIDKDDNIIIVNHFPFTDKINFRKKLKNGSFLKDILKNNKNIKLFLHGHTHQQNISITDDFPTVLDSGSLAHIEKGSWNLIDIEENDIKISQYNWNNNDKNWDVLKTHAIDI